MKRMENTASEGVTARGKGTTRRDGGRGKGGTNGTNALETLSRSAYRMSNETVRDRGSL